MLSHIDAFARGIIRDAGAVLLRGFRAPDLVVEYKSRTDLVTNIDRESERLIFDALRREFPGHVIIAEEGSRAEEGDDYVWYVDPLDGTNNFAHGIACFCVSIGVYSRREGRMAAGFVYDPFHDELFHALHGSGSFLNGAPIRVSTTDAVDISIVATGFPYNKKETATNNSREFCSVMPEVQGVRRFGSAALDLCSVACGRIDGYWERQLKPWDCAAGAIIAEEAGGRVTRYDGSNFDPEYPEVLATNGRIHERMMTLLRV